MKIAPEYSAAGRARARRVARRRRGVRLLSDDAAAGLRSRRRTGRAGPRAPAARRAQAPAAAAVAACHVPIGSADVGRTDDRAVPSFTGSRVRRRCARSRTLVPYIDWTFFFAAWELKGRFPAILDHPQYGAAARELYDARARRCSSASWPSDCSTVRGVYGFWPAQRRWATTS